MRIAIFVTLFCASTLPAFAQAHVDHWGVSATFTPRWKSPATFDDLYDVTPTDVSGNDFRVGFVRGKQLGREWGVSLVHKRIGGDSTLGARVDRCEVAGECQAEGDLYTLSNASMTGVMFHVAMPFAKIGRSVQFELLLGGGLAGVSGDVTHETRTLSYLALPNGFVSFNRTTSGAVITQTATGTFPATQVIQSPMPLVDVQLAVSAAVAPGLKLRASGGMSTPGVQPISISFVYHFGPK